MTSLIKAQSNEISLREEYELEVKQTEALTALAKASTEIATFVTSGGLSSLLSGVARGNAVSAMLGGLTQHAGRDGLDARTLKQNAIEIVEQIEAVFTKFEERLSAKRRGEERDGEVKNAEDLGNYSEWVKKKEEQNV